ncbi:hypothetical protein EVJ58_g1128 [Rhodofomes roseus]|uniref:Uncharacterized protein n=1 Tax=Rhodofomes roseus TaxID=34475 RepID=A0A4Y9Z2Z0_9APHY|nr:hypothetical protein EVJ58_g1128 [Rhodofomes roseus]
MFLYHAEYLPQEHDASTEWLDDLPCRPKDTNVEEHYSYLRRGDRETCSLAQHRRCYEAHHAPPPTKLPAPTRQPLRNRTAVPSSSTVRGSVVKQDGLSQPGNVSGRKFIPGTRATSRSVAAREKAPVPVASLPSGKRSASTVQDVVAKSNKEAQADGNIPIDAKEATTPSHQEKSCALHAKIDQDDVAGLVLPTVEAIKPEVALIGGHELAASIAQDTTVGQDGQPTSPSSEVDADEGGVPAHDDDRFEVAPEDKHEIAMTLEESVSQPGPSDVDVLSDATALEVDVGKLDSSIAEAQQFKRKHDNEDMTTTPSPSDKHEEVANVPTIPTTSKTESIPEVSFDSPVADNADPCTVPLPTDDDEIDTVDEVPIVCIALPADSPTGLEVISSGTETPASTIYSADVSDFDSGNSQDKQTASLTEDTEGLATEAGDIPSDLEVPAGEASQARPGRLAVSDTILSINGLHEEQVGASIEIVDSAGLPAVDAVHELGQNYWKSIFDVSEDESSFVGGSHTDDSMDEEALEKIREELSRPMPEPPIPKFADWVDPVLAMTAVGVIPKDLGEFSGPHGSEQGPVQPTGVYVPHPVAAALALKDSKTGRMGSGFLGMFMGRTSSASSMSSAASRPSTPPLPPSPPVDTPQLIDGSASPDSPSSPSPRSVSPESIPLPVTPPASDTVTAPAVPRPSKLKSLRRLFGFAN